MLPMKILGKIGDLVYDYGIWHDFQ